MTGLIYCQLAYALAGLLFNLMSWRAATKGKTLYTATDPIKGMISMVAVMLVTVSYPLLGGWIYRIGWILLIMRILPGGVVRHVRAILIEKNLEDYASPPIAILAVSINIFGVSVGMAGVIVSIKNYAFPVG